MGCDICLKINDMGYSVSRVEALRVAREILETAEKERLACAEDEANRLK